MYLHIYVDVIRHRRCTSQNIILLHNFRKWFGFSFFLHFGLMYDVACVALLANADYTYSTYMHGFVSD